MRKRNSLHAKFKGVVASSTVRTRDGEFLTMAGVRALEKLFLKEVVHDVLKSPEMLASEVIRWQEHTRGMIQALISLSDAMDETSSATQRKILTEYEKELCQ